jgi:hypothetical protein
MAQLLYTHCCALAVYQLPTMVTAVTTAIASVELVTVVLAVVTQSAC